MTHICVVELVIIGSDNGLLPVRHQAIVWTNAEKLWIGPLGTIFSEILIGIQTFSFKKLHLKTWSALCKMASGLSRPQCVNHLYNMKLLLEAMPTFCPPESPKHISVKFYAIQTFSFIRDIKKCCLQNFRYFVSAWVCSLIRQRKVEGANPDGNVKITYPGDRRGKIVLLSLRKVFFLNYYIHMLKHLGS